MNSEMRSLSVAVAIGAALFAALWFVAIAPKRADNATVKANVAAQQARLDAAKAQLTAYTASRKQFSGMLSELRRLDKAVPARGDISALLRELQRRAKVRDSDLRLVALKGGANAPAADAAGAAAAAAKPAAPGAVTGPGGLSALPFTFEYTGKYFDLLGILKAVRRSVRVRSGDLEIGGRLLTIDGLSFKPSEGDRSLTKATLNATAYIAPDGSATQPPVAATPAAPATALSNGGS